MKDNWKPISIFVALFTLFVLFEVYSDKPIDWTPTYSRADKIPYGTYLAYELLPGLFSHEIIVNDKSFYENKDLLNGTSSILLIQNNLNKMDSLEQDLLFRHVAQGATAFVATSNFSYELKDSLKFNIEQNFSFNDSTELNNTLTALDTSFTFQKRFIHVYFSKFDSTQATVLGKLDTIGANYIKMPYGKGNFLLHCTPQLFSNYNMVYAKNSLYIEKALTHLPNRTLIWDEYYNQVEQAKDKMYLIRTNKALNSARLVLYFGLFLYVIFYGKRLQRIIPIIKPPTNRSFEFVQSIASLYFFKHNNKNVAEKRIAYFFEFLRNEYGLTITTTDKESALRFAEHLEVKARIAERFFWQITNVRTQKNIDDLALTEFNDTLEQLYQQLRK